MAILGFILLILISGSIMLIALSILFCGVYVCSNNISEKIFSIVLLIISSYLFYYCYTHSPFKIIMAQ